MVPFRFEMKYATHVWHKEKLVLYPGERLSLLDDGVTYMVETNHDPRLEDHDIIECAEFAFDRRTYTIIKDRFDIPNNPEMNPRKFMT